MLHRIRGLVSRADRRVIYECRHCGTRVEERGEPCPDCGTSEIARIAF